MVCQDQALGGPPACRPRVRASTRGRGPRVGAHALGQPARQLPCDGRSGLRRTLCAKPSTSGRSHLSASAQGERRGWRARIGALPESVSSPESSGTELGLEETPERVDRDWARHIVGWTVQFVSGEELGKVLELTGDPEGVGHALLTIEQRDGSRSHLIPLVRAIVPSYDPRRRVLIIDPPEGLLDMSTRGSSAGRELDWLMDEIQALWSDDDARPDVGGRRAKRGQMPSHALLRSHKRQDLVRVVDANGGHFEVANALGLRPVRRPVGYWDEDNLETEIEQFVASFWREDPGAPPPTQRHELTGEVREGEGDEVGAPVASMLMPSSTLLKQAGRWDLHNAVKLHGGYKEVAAKLRRVPYRSGLGQRMYLRNPDALVEALWRVMASLGDMGALPSQSKLRGMGRHDLDKAVTYHGGYARVASLMGIAPTRRKAGYWQDARNVAREFRAFARAAGGDPSRCPTFAELAKAKRHDLKYAMEVHGKAEVARMLAGNEASE